MSIFQTISTELKYIKFAFQLVKRAGRVDNYPMETVADLIEDQVKKNENKTAIEFEDKKYKTVLPPLSLLSKEQEKQMMKELKSLDFYPERNIAA